MQFMETKWVKKKEFTGFNGNTTHSTFATDYIESEMMQKQEHLEGLEDAYHAMPDKNSFTAQYFREWIDFYRDEIEELKKAM
jgi:hypothetical protein